MLMQHSDLDFPKHTQLFPRRKEILDYLDQYALNVCFQIPQRHHSPAQKASLTPRSKGVYPL